MKPFIDMSVEEGDKKESETRWNKWGATIYFQKAAMLTWESFEETNPMGDRRVDFGMMDSKWIWLRGKSYHHCWYVASGIRPFFRTGYTFVLIISVDQKRICLKNLLMIQCHRGCHRKVRQFDFDCQRSKKENSKVGFVTRVATRWTFLYFYMQELSCKCVYSIFLYFFCIYLSLFILFQCFLTN